MRPNVLLSAFLCSACVPQPAGAPPGDKPTIVSLNPCTDAILVEVADPGQLLAISHFSHDPHASSMGLAKAARFAETGGTVEEVLALDPDVVVAGTFLPPATRAAFERLGIEVETVGIAATPEESEAQVARLADLAGHPGRGAALNAEIARTLAATKWRGRKVSTLLWQEGGIVPGAQTLIVRLLDHTGFANHSAARGLGQGAYLPLEEVLADPPVLVLATSAERMLAHPALRHLTGTRYETLDASLLYCGGPSIVRTLKRLAALRRDIG